MNLAAYLDLYELLEHDSSTRTERRAFGLEHVSLKEKPEAQLLAWTADHRTKLKRPLLSETLQGYLYGITLTLSILAFLLGLFSGIGLLSYSGHEPVNVIYFMAMVILLPLFTMTLTLFSMFRANQTHSMLVHISPAFWMEKVLSLFPNKIKKKLEGPLSELKISPLILNWLVIKRSQLLALVFSTGLLVALLAMVSTRDIAFAWSSTLNVNPDSFHHLLETVAFPWRDLFPWAVPSVELVSQSHYYRLGENVNEEMIKNASLLGEWWKFLLFSTLFYAIILRFGIYLLSQFGLNKAIERSFLTLDGSQKLLSDMNEPIITTSAKKSEEGLPSKDLAYKQIVKHLNTSYDTVLGWALDKEKILPLSDSMHVESVHFFEVGGSNTLEEDKEVIAKCKGEVLLYVKAWEPPTMDFVDFLEMLCEKVEKVTVAAVGTAANTYVSTRKERAVWARKLTTLNASKVWFYAQ